jgi:hypothetical protein
MNPSDKTKQILEKWQHDNYTVVHVTISIGSALDGDLLFDKTNGRIWAFSPGFPQSERIKKIEAIARDLYLQIKPS